MTILTQIAENMKTVLTDVAAEAAEKANLIKRQGKITGSNLCQTVVFSLWQNPDASLGEIAQMGKCVGLDITPQGIDDRWNSTTALFLYYILQAIVNRKVSGEKLEQPAMQAFSHVYVEDSSVVVLPEELTDIWQGLGGKGSTSSVKLQTRLDLKHGQLNGPHLVDGTMHDRRAATNHHPQVEKGALQLQDLGYWKLTEWVDAEKEGFFKLSYLKTSTYFWHADQVWTAATWCENCEGDTFETNILLGKKTKIPVRLLGFRAAPDIVEEKRRKLKRNCKERGTKASKARLALCEWTLLVTNVPPELMPARAALTWANVRWQIELLFKLWKSIGKIDKSRSENPWRKLCELYAKLIAMTIQHWVFIPTIWRFPDRSWTKAAQVLQDHVIRFVMALKDTYQLEQVLESLVHILDTGCRVNFSKKQPRTCQKLKQLAQQNA